jgi:putative MATE family efflux protein
VLSVLIFFAADGIASLLQMPVAFREMGVTYMKIVGMSTFAISGMMALSAAIRNTGNTRGPMLVTLFINLLHISLNYILIFGQFGLPRLGLEGAAISTATTRVIGLVILFWMFQKAFGARIRWRELVLFDRKLLRKIGEVGLPMAGSAISWSLSQLVLVSLVASMGTTMLATKTYMNMLESFAYLGGWSMALATQIQVSYLYGADLHERAYRSPFIAFRWGLLVTMINVGVLLLVGRDILRFLTDDPTIIHVGSILLWMGVVLQPLKFTNMPVATAINAVGDSKYMFKINALSMWVISIGGTWFFGKTLHGMLYGVYLAMILDELTRGIFVFRRWMSKVKLNID